MNQKRYLLISLFLLCGFFASAKQKQPNSATITKAEVEGHVRFLAADELMGRKAGSEGLNIAARYIAEQFRASGVQMIPNHDSYYQSFSLDDVSGAESGEITWGEDTWNLENKLLVMGGDAFEYDGEIVFAKYGLTEEDYKGLDVNGKVVVLQIGAPDEPNAFAAMRMGQQKQKLAMEKGAVGVIELYSLPVPWAMLSRYLKGGRMDIHKEDVEMLPTFWIEDGSQEALKSISSAKNPKMKIMSSGMKIDVKSTQNVVGFIEGTDPKLKDEYILLTAHYDHVGVGEEGAPNVTPEDRIFNGARDNAIGTTAIISAARALAKNPPKRSVVLIALTAEEVGLLGSKYYAENPMLPLNKCIFNLNIDNGGYNDTSIVTVIGLSRTGAKDQIANATSAFSLESIDDPAPEQGLFDRSDNVNFAAKGIPSPTFSLGFRAFDAEIQKYYHQVTDDAESVDFDYVLKYCRSYAYAAELIANLKNAPQWEKGDKYEEAGKKLYGN